MKIAAVLALSLLTSPGLAQADAPRWVAAYAYAPSNDAGPRGPASAPNPNDPRGPLGPTQVEAVTLTQTALVSVAGDRMRLRLSNAYGDQPIVVGGVTISHDGQTVAATFDGATGVTLAPGAAWLSDPVALPVSALDRIAVAIAYPQSTTLPTRRVRQTMRGADGIESAPHRLGALLSGIEVETDAPPGVIVAFGDSITEGTGSLLSGPGGWPERLAARLFEAGRPWAVVNAGIGGNRLLNQGSGPSGLERLDADALVAPGGRCLILLEGINDIGRPARPAYAHQTITAEDLIAGYRQVIARAHAAGFKIVLATIPPFEGANYFTADGEAIRQSVNAWLRTQTGTDRIVDFDAVLRDPSSPSKLLPAYHSGDWLHPSDAGYQVMAETVPLDTCD
ncbi:lysophospholipase L1-like esterase [Brevundimonas vesicularis]|uniref:SGNH/GDSL hydrolase family protein n=1 Tax=Brevundimonas vesicularis TaxID=41276 RepID=UPI00277D7136|nr:SGNH/GDSL hydrolase family protein [Brevundimonas vesicularis]MDQ1191898.1 lysophospholipase L1-like esterase [Brevundimonas vesicularis]